MVVWLFCRAQGGTRQPLLTGTKTRKLVGCVCRLMCVFLIQLKLAACCCCCDKDNDNDNDNAAAPHYGVCICSPAPAFGCHPATEPCKHLFTLVLVLMLTVTAFGRVCSHCLPACALCLSGCIAVLVDYVTVKTISVFLCVCVFESRCVL